MSGKHEKKKLPREYRHRTYRDQVARGDLRAFTVQVKETDLQILAGSDCSDLARELVLRYRRDLEDYIAARPLFLTSLEPISADPLAPAIVKDMLAAGEVAGVGPMAAVAGAMAEYVGRGLLAAGAGEVMVENGGDIFLHRQQDCRVAIFAGDSPLSNRVGLLVRRDQQPTGICTSSGTVGHSLSFGKADAVAVLAPSTSLADALATRIGNAVKSDADIDRALDLAQSFAGVTAVLIIRGDRLGVWGDVELVRIM